MSFFSEMKSYAMTAGAMVSIPYEIILAQWYLESSGGTSDLAKRAKNFAGIKYNSHADFKSGAYAGYNTLNSFVSDYARVMSLSYYDKVRSADGIEATIKALDASPYAEDPQYGAKLLSVIKKNNLSSIVGTGVTSPSGSGPGGVIGGLLGGVGSFLKSPITWVLLFLLFLFKK